MEPQAEYETLQPGDPTLSLLLPTYRDGWRLGVQLDACVPQLRPCDELIVLCQQPDDVSEYLRARYESHNVHWKNRAHKLGICPAYNECARMAEKTHVIGLSGNDEWQPGALAAIIEACEMMPDARVLFGHITTWEMLPWLPCTGWVRPEWLPAIWRQQGWMTHGAAAVIRRDAWGDGYEPTLGYMADHYQTMMLAFEFSCGYIRHKISRVNFMEGGESQAHANAVSREKEKEQFLWLVEHKASALARERFRVFESLTGWSKPEA